MRFRWPGRLKHSRAAGHEGLHYDPKFLSGPVKAQLRTWLSTLYPLWEYRFPEGRPPPEGQPQRRLLRPVYWLSSWQFACLDYYRPPKGVVDRAIVAEPYPEVMAPLVKDIEALVRRLYPRHDVPERWALTTCLVNFYGRRREGEAWVDTARVGEHKDFEPGPVASLSLGERALFQFVKSTRPGERDGVVSQQWLDDGSLQLFGGDRWKKHTFHRVQRVDRRDGHRFELHLPDFETRRVNFTFRYVPAEHVVRFRQLGAQARADVTGYMRTLAEHSPFFARELAD